MLSGGEMLTEPAALSTGWRYPSFEQPESGENTLTQYTVVTIYYKIIQIVRAF